MTGSALELSEEVVMGMGWTLLIARQQEYLCMSKVRSRGTNLSATIHEQAKIHNVKLFIAHLCQENEAPGGKAGLPAPRKTRSSEFFAGEVGASCSPPRRRPSGRSGRGGNGFGSRGGDRTSTGGIALA